MTTAVNNPQIVPRRAAPALRAADQGVADALESVLSDNTRRVYGAQWRLFNDWCDSVVLRSMPAEPLTVARYLAVRAAWPHSPSSKSTSGRATTLLQRSRCKRVCDKFGGDRQDRRNIQQNWWKKWSSGN